MIVLHDLTGKKIELKDSSLIATVPRKRNYTDPTIVLIRGMGEVKVRESVDDIIEKIHAESVSMK
jgi:uncharacterized protein YlzI (FlbEa/FlbD family)